MSLYSVKRMLIYSFKKVKKNKQNWCLGRDMDHLAYSANVGRTGMWAGMALSLRKL